MRIVHFSSALLLVLLLGAGTAAATGKKPKPAEPINKPVESSAKQTESSAQPAVIRKPSVDVHSGPDFATPTVTTLKRDAAITVTGQQDLWFRVALPDGKAGFVRVNEVRLAYASKETGGGMKALFTGKASKGRVSETAGVRGLDESDLKAATFDATQLAKLESYRVTPDAAAQAARSKGWSPTQVAYATEFKPKQIDGKAQSTQGEKRGMFGAARGLLSSMGGVGGTLLGAAAKAIPKSEQEITEEELALGPGIAGRILGAAPLWKDDAAQRRVNLIGRWEASQTSRPTLPWTFGIIDSSEINAFAAPGGYILVTRGLYQLLSDDAEVAAVLGHEICHVVQRDHYEVIHKQEMLGAGKDIAMSQVGGGGSLASSMARNYLEKNGALVMMASLDKSAEYRSDEASAIYLARAGFNPLALYAVLQKMTALGAQSAQLTQLFKTHPALDDRMDRIDRSGYKGLEQYTSRN
ncbi:M48 family metalloprotease [Thermomonas sp.]|uniref:M48 family metalloprotease n=1 Tax=Thermomonas sp. TaxID=1971895 RepID=UPI002487A072|nr:M48 family metalloprotease [Thermomonas sp.]MDI1252092.1 M48 family metalloprotease [Thermomonas sp.]